MEQKAKRIKNESEIETDKICYWKSDEDGYLKDVWIIYFPSCGAGNLLRHKVIENSDGTITVTPSILTTGHHEGKPTAVHGYLTNGIWRDC